MVRTLPRPHRFQPDTCGTRCISCSSAWLGSSAEIAHRTASSSTVHSRTRAPRQSTNITHEHHASLSRLQIIPLSRLSRRLASSRAHLERRLLRRRLHRRLDRLHRAARSSVSHPRSRTRARAHHHRSHRARLPRSNARRPIPHPLSPFRDLRRSPRPSFPPLSRASPSIPPLHRVALARTSTTVSIASARTASSLDIVRPLPLVAVAVAVARARGSSTRSVGRDRDRVSFAFLSRSVVQIPRSVYTTCFIFV